MDLIRLPCVLPSCEPFRKCLDQTRLYLAAPSANLSKRISPTCAQHEFQILVQKLLQLSMEAQLNTVLNRLS